MLVGIICSIMSILTLVGMATMSEAGVTVKDNTVLVLNLSGSIAERVEDNPFAALFGNSATSQQGLNDILAAIKHAKEEDKVKGIYIEGGMLTGASPATLQAIRKALVEFKKSGKFVVAYADTYTQGSYYVSSMADSVLINPQGMIEWSGLSMQTTYYKDLLEKIGVKMQVFKVGTFKSAVEPFLLSSMSDANREQITVFSNEIWSEMVKDVSKSRKLTADKLNEMADSVIMFSQAKEYKKMKLVDKLVYSDEVRQTIANMMDVEDPDDYNTISPSELASVANSEPKGTSGNIIAVYYTYGSIVQESSSNFGGVDGGEIVGRKVIDDLKALADDDDVKAVVLRVNSGGGSAYASEQIWHQVMNIKSKKPIIVSMGGYAASGGYYISCAADWIIAEPTTITGSIGIFGMFPEASELLNDKLGVHFNTVNTNAHSDMLSNIARPVSPSEAAIVQRYINNGYELFTKRCADGRKMKQDDIKKIAEGRVWTGLHAKQIGLVDQLGGIDDAISIASKRAKVDEYTVLEYPGKSSIFDNLLKQASGSSYADGKMQQALGEYYNIFTDLSNIGNKCGVQASLPYYLMFNL